MLSELEIKNYKPKDKPYKKPDGKGLYLHVATTGKKTWLYRYRLDGKEKMATLGTYPEMKGPGARLARIEARNLVKQGISPTEQQKAQKRANLEAAREQARQEEEKQAALAHTFEAIARDWHEQKNCQLKPKTRQAKWNSLVNHVFPEIGLTPITDISRKELVALVRDIEVKVSSFSAGRVGERISEVFSFAQDSGLIDGNPATRLKSVLKPHTIAHRKMLPTEQMPKLLRLLTLEPEVKETRPTGQCHEVTRAAMLFTILTAARQNEVRLATWDEIDYENALWRIPGEHMKMKRPHTVPLTRGALDILDFIKYRHGSKGLVFSISRDGGPLSENTMQFALKKTFKMDGDMHGFRAFFLTTAKSLGVFYERAVGAALAHQDQGGYQSDAAYDRGDYLELRRPIMQWYCDWLDAMRKSGRFEPPENYLPPALRRSGNIDREEHRDVQLSRQDDGKVADQRQDQIS